MKLNEVWIGVKNITAVVLKWVWRGLYNLLTVKISVIERLRECIPFSADMKLTNKLKDLEKAKKATQVQDELHGRYGEATQGSRGQKQEIQEVEEDACIELDFIEEEKAPLSARVKEAIKNKVKEHNDKHGDKKGKRVTQRMLEAVFRRGVGAYNTNPQSVRPSVRRQGGSDRWAYARINAFLFAVRRNRYRSGKFDRDLLPSGHPLKSNKKIG